MKLHLNFYCNFVFFLCKNFDFINFQNRLIQMLFFRLKKKILGKLLFPSFAYCLNLPPQIIKFSMIACYTLLSDFKKF